jgi:hypothetical protein
MKETMRWLNDGEKSLIAMGAAMGAGCRTCAEKLNRIALDQNLSREEILSAFLEGLEGKAEALRTMRAKVQSLWGEYNKEAEASLGLDKKLAALIRTAAFMAANSAPDACREMEKSLVEGVTGKDLKLCRSIARLVRDQAMKFSDQEIEERLFSGSKEEEKTEKPLVSVCGEGCACSCG